MNEIMKRPFEKRPGHYYFPGINQYMETHTAVKTPENTEVFNYVKLA